MNRIASVTKKTQESPSPLEPKTKKVQKSLKRPLPASPSIESTSSKVARIAWNLFSVIVFPIGLIRLALWAFSYSHCCKQQNRPSKAPNPNRAQPMIMKPDTLEDLKDYSKALLYRLTKTNEDITFEITPSVNRIIEADTTRKVIKLHPFVLINPNVLGNELKKLFIHAKQKNLQIDRGKLLSTLRAKTQCKTFQMTEFTTTPGLILSKMWRSSLIKRAIKLALTREIILLKYSNDFYKESLLKTVTSIFSLSNGTIALAIGLYRYAMGSWPPMFGMISTSFIMQNIRRLWNIKKTIPEKASAIAQLTLQDIDAQLLIDRARRFVHLLQQQKKSAN